MDLSSSFISLVGEMWAIGIVFSSNKQLRETVSQFVLQWFGDLCFWCSLSVSSFEVFVLIRFGGVEAGLSKQWEGMVCRS